MASKTKRNTEGERLPPEIALLIRIVDEGYDRKAWHGPNLRGSIRGLSADQAAWRPRADRHSIAEIVVHAAYWKYVVRRRLRNAPRGAFPLKGSNWFSFAGSPSQSTWMDHVALLEEQHRALREAILEFPPERLLEVPTGAKVSQLATITGIAAHDVYHAGQIQLLKRLQSARP